MTRSSSAQGGTLGGSPRGGHSVHEIASITGHTHAEVSRILEAHYLHRDPAIALAAINKLETAFVRVAAA